MLSVIGKYDGFEREPEDLIAYVLLAYQDHIREEVLEAFLEKVRKGDFYNLNGLKSTLKYFCMLKHRVPIDVVHKRLEQDAKDKINSAGKRFAIWHYQGNLELIVRYAINGALLAAYAAQNKPSFRYVIGYDFTTRPASVMFAE